MEDQHLKICQIERAPSIQLPRVWGTDCTQDFNVYSCMPSGQDGSLVAGYTVRAHSQKPHSLYAPHLEIYSVLTTYVRRDHSLASVVDWQSTTWACINRGPYLNPQLKCVMMMLLNHAHSSKGHLPSI